MALLGLPQIQGLSGVGPIAPAGNIRQQLGSIGPINQMGTVNQPAEPFVWGEGGRRLSPDDLAIQQQLAQQQMAAGADFSPVGSVWEGLGRVVQGVQGGMGQRDARRAAEANAAESDAVAQALVEAMSGGSADPAVFASALANPYVTDEVRQLAGLGMQMAMPNPSDDPEVIRLSQIANDPNRPEWERQTAQDRILSIVDPLTTASVGDVFFTGRGSQLGDVLRGSGMQDVSGAGAPALPTAPVGRLTPIEGGAGSNVGGNFPGR